VSRWVDVRVSADQQTDAITALLDALGPLTFQFDAAPHAAGPEVEISVQDVDEARVGAALNARGVAILASRTRVAPALEVRS
jgi:hypothetical protein